MRVYISGKITGDDNYQEKFLSVEKMLTESGYEVINPCTGEEPGHTWKYYMKRDIQKLMLCDAVYLLKDWNESPGAKLEYYIAKKLKYTIFGENQK